MYWKRAKRVGHDFWMSIFLTGGGTTVAAAVVAAAAYVWCWPYLVCLIFKRKRSSGSQCILEQNKRPLGRPRVWVRSPKGQYIWYTYCQSLPSPYIALFRPLHFIHCQIGVTNIWIAFIPILILIKVLIFWEGNKNLTKSPNVFLALQVTPK